MNIGVVFVDEGLRRLHRSSATVVIKRFMIIAFGNRPLCPQLVPGG